MQTFFNYVTSFFSTTHQNALADRVLQLIQIGSADEAGFQIALEKLAALQGRGFWNQDLPFKLPELAPLLYTKEAIQSFPHQILPYQENGRYSNYPGEAIWSQFFETLRLRFIGIGDEVTNLPDLHEVFHLLAPVTPRNYSDDPLITWIGHTCVLIQVSGMNLLFDP